MRATRSCHGWVHMFITHCLQLNFQLRTVDLVRTCRASSFCTVAWQLTRFQLTQRIARSLGDSWASCYLLSLCNTCNGALIACSIALFLTNALIYYVYNGISFLQVIFAFATFGGILRCTTVGFFSFWCNTSLWQAHGQTHDDSINCANIASHGNNPQLAKVACFGMRPLQRYGDLTVFRMAAVRHLGFLKFNFLMFWEVKRTFLKQPYQI